MRKLHRWVSTIAAIFLLYVALTGVLLTIDNIAVAYFLAARGTTVAASVGPGGVIAGGVAEPMTDADLGPMMHATLAAAAKAAPGAPVKVIRLRMFGGMKQGVVIAGSDEPQQLVFDTSTGNKAGLYEEGYPKTGFPFGWGVHEVVKQMHRGDIIGLTGRWMDLFTGLALLFLAISGIAMYFDMWGTRTRMGRKAPFWR